MAASSTADPPLCRLFSLADIHSATGGFSEAHVIGRGGFGKVYKAVIDGGSATVAVKRLASNSKQGEKEFAMEMETLSKVRHRNLVSLIGYCREEGEMILVYEYMAKGTLADHLYKLPADLEPLSWNQCLRICIGAGRGLDYLHSGCSIIHRDVKSTNILLDESFRAKVSDFGLAKHLGGEESVSHVSASVKGSFGYFDPSYFTTGWLTRASDVYAFGVVLLEVLSGRSALDPWMVDEGYLCMSMWAQEKIRRGKADQIVAPVLRGEVSESCLKTFVGVAGRCLHNQPKKRITMTRAVAQLELALEQHESRGTGASRFLFWRFRNRAVASGSKVHKDESEELEPEATHLTNKQTSVDTQTRALRVDELPIYVPNSMDDSVPTGKKRRPSNTCKQGEHTGCSSFTINKPMIASPSGAGKKSGYNPHFTFNSSVKQKIGVDEAVVRSGMYYDGGGEEECGRKTKFEVPHPISGDPLSALLEQKLKELTTASTSERASDRRNGSTVH